MYLLIATTPTGEKFSKGYFHTKKEILHVQYMLRKRNYSFEIVKVEDPDKLEMENEKFFKIP